VVVLDNCSTDATPEMVQGFKGLPIMYIRNPQDLAPFGNFNRLPDFAARPISANPAGDDLIAPQFYEIMAGTSKIAWGSAWLGAWTNESMSTDNA